MKYHEWSPGNNTTYKLYIQTNISEILLSSEDRVGYGKSPYSPSSMLLTWMRYGMAGGISAVVGGNDYLHWTYLSEKLGEPGVANIAAILSFLNQKYDMKVGMPPGFDTNGIYTGINESVEDQVYETW